MCSPSGLLDLARKTTHLLEKERTTAIIMELFTIIIIIVIILTRRWPTVLWSNDVAHFISTILSGVNTIATFLTIQVLLKSYPIDWILPSNFDIETKVWMHFYWMFLPVASAGQAKMWVKDFLLLVRRPLSLICLRFHLFLKPLVFLDIPLNWGSHPPGRTPHASGPSPHNWGPPHTWGPQLLLVSTKQ